MSEMMVDPRVTEMTGVIKWFDPAKGYGFIVPDNSSGQQDIFLHVENLRDAGQDTAPEGARVRCFVIKTQQGLRVDTLLEMNLTTAKNPSEKPPQTHRAPENVGEWEHARVMWFNRQLGYGFVNRGNGTPDIFVHMEIVRDCGFATLTIGQELEVCYGKTDKGDMAAGLRTVREAECGTGLSQPNGRHGVGMATYSYVPETDRSVAEPAK
jgi:cold shock protein